MEWTTRFHLSRYGTDGTQHEVMTMAKFNLYAHETDIAERPAFKAVAVARAIPPAYFATGLGLWFLLMFALAWLILAN
jgi:hypothetical protein